MALAYVLISVKNRSESRVAAELVKHKAVVEIHMLYGLYDMIAKVKAKDLETLHDFTVNYIGKLKDIASSSTLIVADKTKEDNKL